MLARCSSKMGGAQDNNHVDFLSFQIIMLILHRRFQFHQRLMRRTRAMSYAEELLLVFRSESQPGYYRTSQHKYLCNLLRAVEVRCLKTTDPTSAMYFEHTTLVDIVNTIRENDIEYPEWHTSETAKLYEPKIFGNKKC